MRQAWHIVMHTGRRSVLYTLSRSWSLCGFQLLLDTTTVPGLEGEQNRFINEIRSVEVT
jgi:hypothetical protein